MVHAWGESASAQLDRAGSHTRRSQLYSKYNNTIRRERAFPKRVLSQDEIKLAVSRFNEHQLATAMRYGWFGHIRHTGQTEIVATNAVSARKLAQTGTRMDAFAPRQQLIDAIIERYEAELESRAARHLSQSKPHLSAFKIVTTMQAITGLCVLGGMAGIYWSHPVWLTTVMAVLFATLFVGISIIKLASVFVTGSVDAPGPTYLKDDELPVYSVLVPVFKEKDILRQTIHALKRIDYPADKLDVKIIVEEEDTKTRFMAAQLVHGTGFEIITVPKGRPQTKPRALNFALFFACGDLVTIYDAEDIPDPRQLRLAADRFHREPESVVCLQARLTYYNARENWLTRQFTIEYASLFDLLLPMLASSHLPLPLGGTSNHFRL